MNAKERRTHVTRAYKSLVNAVNSKNYSGILFWSESLTFWRKQKITKKKA